MFKRGFVLLNILFIFSSLAWGAPPSPLRLSFEQRVALSYALLGHGLSTSEQELISDRAQAYFKRSLTTEAKKIQVASFEDFLKHQTGAWPNTNSLKLDLEIIERTPVRSPFNTYAAKSPRVQKQIDAYLAQQMVDLYKFGGVDQYIIKNSSLINPNKIFSMTRALFINPNLRQQIVRTIWGEVQGLLDSQVRELEHLGQRISESHMAKSSDKMMQILLQTVFGEYFAELGPDSKKLIMSSYLGSDLKMNEMQKFELMIQNSGPQLQKLLQIVARQADMGPQMTAIFQKLESSVREVPWVQVQEILRAESGLYKFSYFEQKPLGVGTMAQVHRAKLDLGQGNEANVVVRFIKPGMELRIAEDDRILKRVAQRLDANPAFLAAGGPRMVPLVQEATKTVMAELSQPETMNRQELGARAYNRSLFLDTPEHKNALEIHVPRLFNPSAGSRLMIQEMVFGSKLEKEAQRFSETIPSLKKGIAEAVATMWSKEVLFDGGFYHSDLHQGNFLVQVTDPVIRINILDFGMGGVLSRSLQNQVLLLAVGIDTFDAKLVTDAFWKISGPISGGVLTRAQLQKEVAKTMTAILEGHRPAMDFEKWTIWLTDRGMILPYDFVNLNRGFVILNKMLADSGSQLDTTKIMRQLAFKNPLNIYHRFAVEEKISKTNILKMGLAEVDSIGFVPALRCEKIFL